VRLLILVLLSTLAFGQDSSSVAAAQSACGPAGTQFSAKRDFSQHSLSQPEPGKALVYIIQDIGVTRCLGKCVTTRVALDGNWVGANEHNSYFPFAVDEGEHHLCVNRQSHFQMASQMVALAHFTAEPGKVYFFRTRNSGSQEQAFLDLDPIDSDQGRLFVANYPLSTSQPRK